MVFWLKRLLGALLALVFVLPALADSDPPGRVGRLAWTENQVFFRVDRSDAAMPATINWPVSQGALFNTDRDAMAEIRIGSTALRCASQASASWRCWRSTTTRSTCGSMKGRWP